MSDDPFQTLGLSRDADERAIKHAYAQRLRATRPDEDPIGFQELNDAYRSCLEYAAWRDSGGAARPDDDADPLEAGDGDGDRPAVAIRVSAEALAAAIALDRRLADGSDFDCDAFIAGLLRTSSTGSGTDIHRWLQAHPAFYVVGAREALAPRVLSGLLEASDLPPRHLAALLHFFGLNEMHEGREGLLPRIAELRRRAQLTPAHIAAAKALFDPPKPDADDEGVGLPPFWTIWAGIVLIVGLVRCGAALT
ncbi:J domain-containing protein [Lysobacter sp. CCNWLW3]|uniref:J domain-containing protein n=1 Tax=unclassified Lysobacter TaxID=2635362 RepID=UPI002FD26EDC